MGVLVSQGPCFACNSSDAGSYYTDGFKCFSCGISVTNGIRAQQPKLKQENVKFPESYTSSIDLFGFEGLKWLYSHFITEDMIKKYKIGWDRNTKRVVLPTIVENELMGYTCRGFDANQPKYLTVGKPKEKMLICNGHSTIVIVEDFLSGIRLAEIADVLILNGTFLPYDSAQKVVSKYDRVCVWLDSDEPGRKAAAKAMKVLEKVSLDKLRTNIWNNSYKRSTLNNKCSRLDPKCYSTSILKEKLE